MHLSKMEIDEMIAHEINVADERYGDFMSSHEGLGVLMEEFDELRSAIHANKLESVREESIDIAAVATRIAYAMSNGATRKRSKP